MNKELNLIWIDLEMTGLSPINDRIIEIATLVTDPELNIIAEGPNLAIKQPDKVLEAMDEWNQRHHGATGLIEKVRNSLISESEAETRTIEFLERYMILSMRLLIILPFHMQLCSCTSTRTAETH